MNHPVPVLSVELADLLDDASPAEDAATDAAVAAFIAAHRAASRPEILAGWVKTVTEAFATSSRHNSAVSVTVGALKEAAAGFLDARVVVDTLAQLFVAAATRPGPGQRTEAEAIAEFASIVAWGVGQANAADLDEVRARTNEKMPEGGMTMEDPFGDKPREGDPRFIWKTVPGGTFIFDRPKEVPAVWGQGEKIFWAMGEGFMIAGRQGLGKTTLEGLLIAAMVGIGDGHVLGLRVARAGGPVLLLAMDRPSQVAGSLARQFTEHRDRAILDEKLIIRPGPPPVDLAKRPEILAQMATELGAVAVFVDSLKDAALGLSDDEVAASYNRARQTLLMSGRQICDLHHTRKPPGVTKTKTKPTIDDIYGSTWLTSGCGSVILLDGEPGDPVIDLHHVKQPRQEVGSFRVLHDQDAGSLTVEGQVDLVRMAKARGDKGLTISDAAKALYGKENPSRSEKEKARRALNRLVAEGKLICFEGTKGGTDGGVQSVYFYEKPNTEPSREEQNPQVRGDHAGCDPESRPRTDHGDHADDQTCRSSDHATDHADHAPTDHGFAPLLKRGGTDRQSAEEGGEIQPARRCQGRPPHRGQRLHRLPRGTVHPCRTRPRPVQQVLRRRHPQQTHRRRSHLMSRYPRCLLCREPVTCGQGSTHYQCGGVPGTTRAESTQRAADHIARLLTRHPNLTEAQLRAGFRPELAPFFDAGLRQLVDAGHIGAPGAEPPPGPETLDGYGDPCTVCGQNRLLAPEAIARGTCKPCEDMTANHKTSARNPGRGNQEESR